MNNQLKRKAYNLDKSCYSGWLAVPGFLIFIVIFALPTISSFYYGFTTWNLRTSTWTGLENFRQFFTMYNTKDAIQNTVVFTFWQSFIKVVLGLLLAVALSGSLKSREYLKSVIFFPSLLGSVVVAAAWSSIMEPAGPLNQFLALLGIEKIKWLTSHQWAMFSVIIVDVWHGMGTTLVIYLNGLASIPVSYNEAASIDGANAVQKFFHITLPLIVPAINTILTLTLISGFRNYSLVMALTGGGPGYATEVIGSAVYKLFANGTYGIATTGYLIIFMVACFIVIPLNNWISKKEAEL